MDANQPESDLELHDAFGIILSLGCFSDYILAIVELIYNGNLSKGGLSQILIDHDINRIEDIKEELLDLLLIYINLTLNDHIIAENERRNFELLKIYFKIKEGDFYKLRYEDLQAIVTRQFDRLLSDNKIDIAEALHIGCLQEVFDLSFDQIDKFKEYYVRRALESGADIADLDTVQYPKGDAETHMHRRNFSQRVKDLVWERDNGQCQECGGTENIDFHHIIPLSKGGSNTFRNIRLLCESCLKQKPGEVR